jgi:hypothetical protein
MFVVATATFRLLYALIVLKHDRRRIFHFEFTQNPTQVWLSRQMTEAFPWDTAPRYLLRGLVAAMLASRDFKGIRRKRFPIFMLGADHAFQDPMGRWIATGTLAE